jgi:hypothetical protein
MALQELLVAQVEMIHEKTKKQNLVTLSLYLPPFKLTLETFCESARAPSIGRKDKRAFLHSRHFLFVVKK